MPAPTTRQGGTVIGKEWIYRLRDNSPLERVLVLAQYQKKTTSRFDVEFLDGEKAGQVENVPGNRLKGPWATVAEYRVETGNWARVEAYELTETESYAALQVFELLISESAASPVYSSNSYTTCIHDVRALEAITGFALSRIVEQVESFESDDGTVVSAEGTLQIAEAACSQSPAPILEWVHEKEAEYRQRCSRGAPVRTRSGAERTSSPDWEYEWYRKEVRPQLELLRQWCGHRAVTIHERLGAAEAEVQRLGVMVEQLLDALRDNNVSQFADIMDKVNRDEQITPENYRPVVDRPLKPSEMPVRVEYRSRRWGY